ncbi:MAG: CRTAC1 family protein [Gemmatimonadota bacterium]|nr:CRTAC1 family protein [Gemmatimonadota bacterium]
MSVPWTDWFGRRHVVMLAVVVAWGAPGCGGKGEQDTASEGGHAAHDHAAHMAAITQPELPEGPASPKHARLLDIARRIRASSETYFGSQTLRELERADTTAMSSGERAVHEYQLAYEYFKLATPKLPEEYWGRSYARVPAPRTLFMQGIAQFREAQTANCIGYHNRESCIFPLAGGGVHVAQDPTKRAFASFQEVFDATPRGNRPRVRWFTNLMAMALGTYPESVPKRLRIPEERFRSEYDIGRFRDVGLEKGVAAFNLAGGSIMEDFDGDGFLDIVTSTGQLEGQMLYYHNAGDGTFEDRTEESGLTGQLGGLNLVCADYDGDGRRDILVLRGGWFGTWGRHPNSLLRNLGDGRFRDVTKDAGLAADDYPCQNASFADYDLDGDLDLFLGNEQPPPEARVDYPCQLFRNDGDGTFTDVSKAAGVENLRLAKGAAWGDIDGDRDPDLYVSNQFDKNRMYRNNGDGTFTDIAEEMGLDEPHFSFPVWFWDYDNDGALDLFVAGYGGDINTVARSYMFPSDEFGLNALFHNEGGVFRNRAKEAGLHRHSLTMGANFGDLDNDGFPDFYLGTGTPDFDAVMPNVLYRNDCDGTFTDVTFSAGMGSLQKGHGIAFGDIDNDGDQDIYLQSGGMYAFDPFFNSLFENPGHGNGWITISLRGVQSNRDGFGSRIRVTVEEGGRTRDIYQWVWPSGSFGASSIRSEIGLGAADRIAAVEVYWPASDLTQRFTDVRAGRFYLVTEFEDRMDRQKL